MKEFNLRIREIMSKYFMGDKVIWGVIISLSLISVLAVFTSTGTLAIKYQSGNISYYFLRQFSFLAFGIGVVFIAHIVPYRYYSRLAQLFFYISIPLLCITLIVGTTINDASRWLEVPGLGITFQTSDFAKLALIMYLARLLSKKQDVIKQYKEGFRPIIIPVIITSVLILPANFSTAALIFATSLILIFIGRVNLKHLGAFVSLVVLAGFFFGLWVWNAPETIPGGRGPTWKSRIVEFVEGDSDGNYQAEQAKIAVGTNGFLGSGPGNSTQRNFLPHPYSDFIFAIIVEEYGIPGAIIIIMLYLILLYRAGMIVKRSQSQFGAFVTIGLTISLVFQAMVHMAVAVNLLPVTGQTLPLVSMGGTSILFTSTALGVILSVSRTTQKVTENPVQHEPATA